MQVKMEEKSSAGWVPVYARGKDPADVEREFRECVAKLRREHVHPDDVRCSSDWLVEIYDASDHQKLLWRFVDAADAERWGAKRWHAWLKGELAKEVLPPWIWESLPREFYAVSKQARGRRLATVVFPIEEEDSTIKGMAVSGDSVYVADVESAPVRRYSVYQTGESHKQVMSLAGAASRSSKRFDYQIAHDVSSPPLMVFETSMPHKTIEAIFGDKIVSVYPAASGWQA